VLAVHISIPAKTLKEFIEYVRRTPDNSATPRPVPAALVILARAFHFACRSYDDPHSYKGVQAATDLVGGQVQMYFVPQRT